MIYNLFKIMDAVQNAEVVHTKMVSAAPLELLLKLSSPRNASKYMQTVDYDLMHSFYQEIEREQKNLKVLFNQLFDGKNAKHTLEEQYLAFRSFTLRLLRFQFVLKPNYYHSYSANKSSPYKYDLMRINWLDDDGQKFRKSSKSFGRAGEEGLMQSLASFFEDYTGSEVEITPTYSFQALKNQYFTPDLVVRTGYERWAIEVNLDAKEKYILVAVQVETWKFYKTEYLQR